MSGSHCEKVHSVPGSGLLWEQRTELQVVAMAMVRVSDYVPPTGNENSAPLGADRAMPKQIYFAGIK